MLFCHCSYWYASFHQSCDDDDDDDDDDDAEEETATGYRYRSSHRSIGASFSIVLTS